MYYDSVNVRFGVHIDNPSAPMHIVGRTVFEGDTGYRYNRLYIGHATSLSVNSSNGVGYLGFNLFRGSNSAWYRYGDGTHNGGSLILGNMKGDLLFGTAASTGGTDPQTLPDTSFLANMKMILSDQGRLGLGTSDPGAQMEIVHSDNTKPALILNQTSEDTLTNEIQFHRNGTEKWAIGTHLHDDRPNSFFIWNHSQGKADLFIAENGMVGINTLWPSAMLDVEGSFEAQRVGIGTNPPPADSSWKLYVEGGIMAREVKVTANTFPDYVFGSDYSRLSIRDLEEYIASNHKLPGIPSEKEVETEGGINLGEMQVRLLEKIEEQALYIIDLQKQIDELKSLIGVNGEGLK